MATCINPVTYPLSAAQMEIWLAQQIHPNSPVYNVGQFTEIHGVVDPILFEAALRQVVAEAETLRLQFIESGNGPHQFVGTPDWSLPLIDFSSEVDPQATAEVWMRAEYKQPIDLLHGPLFGYALLKIAPNRFFWHQRYHHIALDGVGIALIVQRMAQVYSARVKGMAAQEPPFGPLARLLESDVRYRASAQLAQDRAHWLKLCENWPEPVTLVDRQAPALQQCLRQTAYISSQAVRTLTANTNRLAHFMVAAMAAYLHRLTGAQDVVLGFPMTARFGEEQRIPGTTSNIVPIRLTVQPDTTLSSLMEKAAQEIQGGFWRQRYRSEELRRELGRAQNQPLFGPAINLMPFDYDLCFGEHASTTHNLASGPVDDLMVALYLSSENGPLRIDFDANPTLYTADTVSAHQRRFLRFLDVLATEPTWPIGGIDLLDAAERRQLLVEWNTTERDYPAHLCLHQVFEKQVERTPDATALVYDNQSLSYAELNTRANRLAHQLIELGVQPDARVAICMERSPAMIVGLLAVLKAGGAYIPLDPAYPSERLTHALTDATPIILLADAAGRAALDAATLATLTVLDPNRLPESALTNPQVFGLSPHHLAYIIYTSGSTGTPKGVMIEHQSVVNLAHAQAAYFEVHPGSRVLQFASPGFDASIWEIIMAFGSGAGLYLPPDEARRDKNALWDYLEKHAITHATLPPALLQDGEDLVRLSTPLRLILAGEAPNLTLLRSLLHQGTVFNAYGPTETTICATAWRCPQELSSETILIGRPIANTRLYLLDTQHQPVPLGTAGELYIAGVGIARGYLNRPELSAERFFSDPFSHRENARMYKTGDLARYLPDGNLEFLGRDDHQVKIRGFRIELGEIEARLIEHPQVREAAVVALSEGSQKKLIAYVVAEADAHLPSTLHAHLAARLPEYMMPAAFVHLEALPLTVNGKLDRRALPAPDDQAFARHAYVAPQGETETQLAAIWAELLKVAHISRHDSFFALGGHSLLAVQMIRRVRTTLGIETTLRTLFEAPTVAELAQRLLKLNGAQDDSFDVVLPLQPKGTRPPLFCIHPGTGLSWGYTALSQHLDADQPVYGIQARGLNGLTPLAETFNAMAADYLKQIRRIQPNGPYYLLGWCFGGKVAHSIAIQLEQQGEKVALLALLDTYPKDGAQQSNEAEIKPADEQEKELEATFIQFFIRYSDENIPDAGEYLWEKTRDVIKNNFRILKDFSLPIYSSDVLFFRAAIPDNELLSLSSPDLWQPYVLGDIEAYDIACKHEDMDRPGPIAEIGRILADKLDQLQEGLQSEDRTLTPLVA